MFIEMLQKKLNLCISTSVCAFSFGSTLLGFDHLSLQGLGQSCNGLYAVIFSAYFVLTVKVTV